MIQVVSTHPDPSVVKEIVCRHCGARLKYTPSDVKERHGRDYSGGSDGMEWIDCPPCGQKVVIRSW